MTLTAEEATALLDEITTREELLALINNLDIQASGEVTILYSGKTGITTSSSAHDIWSSDVVRGMASLDENIRVINETEAAQFLNINSESESKNEALIDALERIFGDTPDVNTSQSYQFLYGETVSYTHLTLPTILRV